MTLAQNLYDFAARVGVDVRDLNERADEYKVYATRAALKDADPAVSKAAKVSTFIRDPDFLWVEGDFSSQVSDDPDEGIYVTSNVEPNTTGVWVRVISSRLTPYHFDGAGDGSVDDSPALTRMFAYIRSLTQAAALTFNIPLDVDLSGHWRIETSVNATDIVGWSFTISGGFLEGHCTGEPMLDLVNSRGYDMWAVAFHGDKDNMPAVAYQVARGTTGAESADNQSFRSVSTTGWYDRAAVHVYAHESALHDHCTYYNYNHDAHVAIFEGFDTHPMTSDYVDVFTGSTSFINNKFVNCDFRYLPVGDNGAAITAVTRGATTTITAPGHAFSVGDTVTFAYVGGMPDLQFLNVPIEAVSGDDLTVTLDSTGLPAYTGDGMVIRSATKAAVHISRTEQMNFDCSYIVSYGQPHIEIAFPDPVMAQVKQMDLDILFEGSGNRACIEFLTEGRSCSVLGMRVKTYNSPAVAGIFSLDEGGSGTINFYGLEVSSVTRLTPAPMVQSEEAHRVAIYGGQFLFDVTDAVRPGDYAEYNGTVTGSDAGNTITRGVILEDYTLKSDVLRLEGVPGLATSEAGANPAIFIPVTLDGAEFLIPVHSPA